MTKEKIFPDKYCEHCGEKLVRKRHPSGQLEHPDDFTVRKYCGKDCWEQYLQGQEKSNGFKKEYRVLCKCGCGKLTSGKKDHNKIPQYIAGHQVKGRKYAYKPRPKAYGRVAWNKGLKGQKPWMDLSGLKLGQNRTSEERKRQARRGADSSSWKGGITPLRVAIYKHDKYIEWRTSVFARDNYTCQECDIRSGIKGKKIEAHHIKPWVVILNENNLSGIDEALECDELWDIDNGMTLCRECHKQTFSYCGRVHKTHSEIEQQEAQGELQK